jgi:flavin reductase (DIM6/NTAB) family NADH-FMN oxidoreductase RutF
VLDIRHEFVSCDLRSFFLLEENLPNAEQVTSPNRDRIEPHPFGTSFARRRSAMAHESSSTTERAPCREVESLSAEPLRLLVSVSENSSSWKVLQKYPCFGVNVLRAEQQSLADQFAGRGGLRGLDRYHGATWTSLLAGGASILKDALAAIDCIVEEILPRHGHAIVIGRVRAVLMQADGHPLLYWQGAYRQISQQQISPKE